MIRSATAKSTASVSDTRLGYIYTGYRVVLTLILSLLFVLTFDNPVVGADNTQLYAVAMISYFIFSVLAYISLRLAWIPIRVQLFIGLFVDVGAFTLMLHANGGPSIQLSMLYLVVVVAAYVLVSSRQAMILTLFAIICVIYQQFFYALTNQMNSRGFSNVALLSLSFIGTGLLSHMATRQLRSVQDLASMQATQMHSLNVMNQRIIETIQNGVVVIDNDQKILLSNKSAQRILGLGYARPEKLLSGIDLKFAEVVMDALKTGKTEVLFTPQQSRIQEALSITLNALDIDTTLLTIERISRSQQQAQQMKLASLGRLTASIAHEIRNPIGAISQASQLLEEDPDDPNTQIYAIIHKQTQRVNQIIEDVLKLSRQGSGDQEAVDLSVFVPQFLAEHFISESDVDTKKVITHHISPRLQLNFNRSQLEQIMVNLVENAIHYGVKGDPQGTIQIVGSVGDGRVTLDVIDNGDGISLEDQEKLFEPFFTTSKRGTGLGLYLSKAFCEANGAMLQYIPSQQGSCFRISKHV